MIMINRYHMASVGGIGVSPKPDGNLSAIERLHKPAAENGITAPRFQGRGPTKWALPLLLALASVPFFKVSIHNVTRTGDVKAERLIMDSFSQLKAHAGPVGSKSLSDARKQELDERLQQDFGLFLQKLTQAMKLHGKPNEQAVAEKLLQEGGLDKRGIRLALELFSDVRRYADLQPALNHFANQYYSSGEECQEFKAGTTRFLKNLSNPLLIASEPGRTGLAVVASLLAAGCAAAIERRIQASKKGSQAG